MCVIPGEYCGVIPGTRDFPAGFLTPPFIPPVLVCSVRFSPRGGRVLGALSGLSRAAPSAGVYGHPARQAELDTAWTPVTAPHAPGRVHTGWGGGRLGAQPGSFQPLRVPVVPSALEEMTSKYIKFSLSHLSLWRPQPSHTHAHRYKFIGTLEQSPGVLPTLPVKWNPSLCPVLGPGAFFLR